MADEVIEEDLLRSIEEVDAKIQDFRKRVRALLTDIQSKSREVAQSKNHSDAT